MAKGVGGILGNPAFIGAATAAITWYLLDEVFDDVLEKMFKKKKKNKGHKRVKMVKNKFGEVMPYVSDDEFGVMNMEVDDPESYFGAWERAYY